MLNSFFDKFIFTNSLRYTHNNFYLLNIPFVIFPIDSLTELIAMNNVDFNIKLYSCIKKSTSNELLKQFNIDFGLEGDKSLLLVQQFFTASGWGNLQNINLDSGKKQAIVSVANSPFATQVNGKVSMEADHMLRGILAGLFSHAFKEDVDCVEVKCAAMGSEQCEFIIKPCHEFDLTKKQTREQIEIKV